MKLFPTILIFLFHKASQRPRQMGQDRLRGNPPHSRQSSVYWFSYQHLPHLTENIQAICQEECRYMEIIKVKLKLKAINKYEFDC